MLHRRGGKTYTPSLWNAFESAGPACKFLMCGKTPVANSGDCFSDSLTKLSD